MINLIEAEDELPGNLDQLKRDVQESASLRALSQTEQPNETPAERAERKRRTVEIDDEELPERMRGKDIKDIVEMYKNLESVNGRMANDLGTQRQLTDRLLNLKRQSDLQENAPAPVKVEGHELLDNPTEAVERIMAARLARQEAAQQERLQALELQLAERDFLSKHSDYKQIAADPEFAQWVRATPYRSRTADAAANGDYGAADELLSEYKDRRKLKNTPKPKEQEEDPNLEAARAASLEKAGGEGKGSRKGGKIFSRASLLKLQIEDPEAYYDEAFQAELLRAYDEKRVR